MVALGGIRKKCEACKGVGWIEDDDALRIYKPWPSENKTKRTYTRKVKTK